MLSQHLLSIATWLPILGGVAVLPTGGDRNATPARRLGLGFAVAAFLATIPLYIGFDARTHEMQFGENYPWLAAFHIRYRLGIDGISLLLILLTSFSTVLVVISAWLVIQRKVAQYMAAFLIMEGLMIGVFSALDAILFYVFFELMLVAFIYLYYRSGGSFDILAWPAVKLGLTEQILIFLAFFAAFAVKVPMWPVHTWLPDAHVEAPTGGSVILAAIMLKLGAYGFLRFSLPITPDAAHALDWFMISLSLSAVVYIGMGALVRGDMRKLMAYSSIPHMGFGAVGFFIFNAQGIEGGLIQMTSPGFVSGALFLCVGVMYDRLHSRMIKDYGGV